MLLNKAKSIRQEQQDIQDRADRARRPDAAGHTSWPFSKKNFPPQADLVSRFHPETVNNQKKQILKNPVNPVKKKYRHDRATRLKCITIATQKRIQMNKPIQFIQIIILSAALLIFHAPNAFASPYRLSVTGSRLSAGFENIPLSTLIDDIGAKTGIEFFFLNGAAAAGYSLTFSAQFESVPIRTALEKLLRNYNCSFISDPDDNIRRVFILGLKSEAGSGSKIHSSFVMAATADTGGGKETVPGKGMRIAPASNQSVPEGMQIDKSLNQAVPEGMIINQSPDKSELPEGMQIGPGEGMQITPGEGMQITPGQGMQVGPPGEKGMEIGPPEGMQIGPGSAEGMVISPPGEAGPPEGMQIGPSADESMNPSTDAPEKVVQYQGRRADPKKIVRRPRRWGFRKK